MISYWHFIPLWMDFDQISVSCQLKFNLCLLIDHISGVWEHWFLILIGAFPWVTRISNHSERCWIGLSKFRRSETSPGHTSLLCSFFPRKKQMGVKIYRLEAEFRFKFPLYPSMQSKGIPLAVSGCSRSRCFPLGLSRFSSTSIYRSPLITFSDTGMQAWDKLKGLNCLVSEGYKTVLSTDLFSLATSFRS